MPASHLAPRAQPALRRQRLVRVGAATTLALPASSHIAPVPAAAGPVLPSPFLEKAVWLAIEASRLRQRKRSIKQGGKRMSTGTKEEIATLAMQT